MKKRKQWERVKKNTIRIWDKEYEIYEIIKFFQESIGEKKRYL